MGNSTSTVVRRGPGSSSTGNSSTSTSLSTTHIKEIASQLSHHPQIHNFFRQRTSGSLFRCEEGTLKKLGEVVAAAHEEAVAQGCREAVALALCALPCGNHFTALEVIIPRNSGSAPFLALLADTNTRVLEALTFNGEDWFRRKAEWSLLAHLILHNTTLKSLKFVRGLEKMSEKGGIALADSIRNNRGLEELWIIATDAFGKEGGGLALAAMVRHNSTLRTLGLRNVSLCSRGTEALANALGANRGLRAFSFEDPVPIGSAIIAGLCDCVLETLALCVDAPAADAMIKLLTTSKPGHAGVSTASSANICCSLEELTLDVLDAWNMNGMDAAAAADMIRSNQKLVSITLMRATYSTLEWADTIIPSTGEQLHNQGA